MNLLLNMKVKNFRKYGKNGIEKTKNNSDHLMITNLLMKEAYTQEVEVCIIRVRRAIGMISSIPLQRNHVLNL